MAQRTSLVQHLFLYSLQAKNANKSKNGFYTYKWLRKKQKKKENSCDT